MLRYSSNHYMYIASNIFKFKVRCNFPFPSRDTRPLHVVTFTKGAKVRGEYHWSNNYSLPRYTAVSISTGHVVHLHLIHRHSSSYKVDMFVSLTR